jgi:monofunctional glycosyltransferase
VKFLLRVLTASCAVVFAAAAYVWITLPDVRPLRRTNPLSTAFMQMRVDEALRTGRPLRVRQHWVPYDAIAVSLKKAVLVSEDAKFWQHDGIDYEELRLALQQDWASRRLLRGASTLTQQLAKNLYLSPARTPSRKLRELLLTRRLEATLSKKRIFELYLNLVEWGDDVWGVEAAARAYFGVPASALSSQQSALLAGALINPRAYNPAHPNGRLLRRQQIILGRMGEVAPPESDSSEQSFHGDDSVVPVLGIQPLDAYGSGAAGRVNKRAVAKCEPDVRRAGHRGREKNQIAFPHVVERGGKSDRELLGDGPRHINIVSGEQVVHEAAAVEPRRRRVAAEAVRHALEIERVADQLGFEI